MTNIPGFIKRPLPAMTPSIPVSEIYLSASARLKILPLPSTGTDTVSLI